ncbi:MAG: RecQ family ATP-dependent DNA helicase [Bacteroidetes bacterium]|nr:RecQ family ATP-dependent DNA helicase [Bacteroidota bacterium]MBS1648443.1 RecQ family ATP-dependent DNA helicase [Bacteroidota bacterium]
MLIAQNILKQYWGYDAFRGEQEKIINTVIAKKNVLALLPTGGGKSICFQVPTLMQNGLCIVISPLIALMKDQVENLKKRNITAAAIYSGMSFYEVKETLQKAANENYKFLYLSPERLETKLFKEYLPILNIALVAIDEAHCISQWGYDFRPPYLRIANLLNELKNVPTIALTASATPLVQKDIIEKLQLKNIQVFQQSFEKPNLSYSVFNVDSNINKIITVLNNVQGSSIVYCKNRKLTKQIAELLQLQNISADYYHAGLTQEERNQKQLNWINNQTRVMVCTNAFGMGIDKPDVKTVLHCGVPDCLENYYQEAGRAGRDGKKAYAVLLCRKEDIDELKALPNKRFPVMFDIKKVYQCLADYLQIPVGIGEGNYYNFDLLQFSKNFNLDSILIINVLKVLEQEGHLLFTENIFLPSKIKFICDKFLLEDFENNHPKLEPVMKCLLRTYAGIYDNSVSVSEKTIAKLCKISYEKVIEDLNTLHAFGIIEYKPQKETPQIYFVLNRAPAQSLYINHAAYAQRKQLYIERINAMLNYLQTQTKCRSQYLSAYFGDTKVTPCGICDNCLNNKRTEITKDDFEKIQQAVFNFIETTNNANIDSLLFQLKQFNKEKIWQVLQHLQSEKLVSIKEGIIEKI